MRSMDDAVFYQALFCCYTPNPDVKRPGNCRHCPLDDHWMNDECRRMLHDEIRRRKCEAKRKGDDDGT